MEDDEAKRKKYPANELTTNCKPILFERRRQVNTTHIMYTYKYVSTCIHTHIHTYTYMYICTHTHIYIFRNAWKVLKCGAGEGWRRSVGPIM